ncbi:MAG TPA: SMP-30/gluconolactonase/LRE family protein [Thermohalobaculum sp.]|nr:SMP-30/gluconolactonase/LRE family protein [Thermohalobaculum sp.]
MVSSDNHRVAVDVRCELGEGIIWHAGRKQLMWFDIYRKCAFLADADGSALTAFGFGHLVSSAFIVDDNTVLVASSVGLLSLDLTTGETETVMEIEADNPDTRPNDCRAGPGGSIWFGTMGHDSGQPVGSIYHFRAGELTLLYGKRDCPNAICFSPAGHRAYFSDTFDHRIMTCTIDPLTGLPTGEPEVFVDLTTEGAYPDGSAVDSEGCVWNAHWGAGKVVRYRPDGSFDRSISLPAPRTTCPCLGGSDMKTLFVTTMFGWMPPEAAAAYPLSGAVFAVDVDVPGLPERTVTVGL